MSCAILKLALCLYKYCCISVVIEICFQGHCFWSFFLDSVNIFFNWILSFALFLLFKKGSKSIFCFKFNNNIFVFIVNIKVVILQSFWHDVTWISMTQDGKLSLLYVSHFTKFRVAQFWVILCDYYHQTNYWLCLLYLIIYSMMYLSHYQYMQWILQKIRLGRYKMMLECFDSMMEYIMNQ